MDEQCCPWAETCQQPLSERGLGLGAQGVGRCWGVEGQGQPCVLPAPPRCLPPPGGQPALPQQRRPLIAMC